MVPDDHTGWYLSIYLPPQEVAARDLGLPEDMSVALGDLWISVDGVAYPLITQPSGALRLVSPTLVESGGHTATPSASELDRALELGISRRELRRTGAATQHYASFEVYVIASAPLAAQLGRRARFLADGRFTVSITADADPCHVGPPSRVTLQQLTCFFDGTETEQSRCRVEQAIKPDGIVPLGPFKAHLAVDGGGPCVMNL